MFFGREYYLERLKSLLNKGTSSIVTCRGRCRIGKSTLFEHFARTNGCRFMEIAGQPPVPSKNMTDAEMESFQLRSFGHSLSEQSKPFPDVTPSNWLQAFHYLDEAITDDCWNVVLLDEVSWMAGGSIDFPGALKTAWDTRLKHHDKLVLIICGSVSTWITRNILHNAGFVGRRSVDFTLPELPLGDCAKFWTRTGSRYTPDEILDVLSVTGGVPKYLEEVDVSLSVEDNIRRMCFEPDGYLFSDFDIIFDNVFGNTTSCRREILLSLVDGPKGAGEMAEALGRRYNGHMSDILDDLEQAGFIAVDHGINMLTGQTTRNVRYRLRDNYTRFYLKYLHPMKNKIRKGLFGFSSLCQLNAWNSIMGLQFENLIVNNFHALIPKLHLQHADIMAAEPYRRPGTRSGRGCQIDLLMLTERNAYVIEVKRKKEIGTEVIEEMDEKVAALGTGRRFSPRTVLVYEGKVSDALRARHAFDFMIPASELLEMEE